MVVAGRSGWWQQHRERGGSRKERAVVAGMTVGAMGRVEVVCGGARACGEAAWARRAHGRGA